MRWTIVGLVLVGIIAAAAAAILVVTLKASGRNDRTQEERNNEIIRVLVASRDMPARSTMDAQSVATTEIRRGDAPMNFLSDPVQAVGQMLVQPVKSGEPLTRNAFATAENPVQLSKGLDPGHRIMSIMLSDDTGIDQLLYPGCIVDIIGSFSVPSGITEEDREEKLSVTILQGIPVLAVGPKTLVSTPEGAGPTAGPGDSAGRRARIVAFDLTVKQAEMLQLAAKYGTVSVSLRNPLDVAKIETTGTLMGEFFKDLGETVAALTVEEEVGSPLSVPDIKGVVSGGGNGGTTGATTSASATPTRRATLYHTTTVLRGKDVEQMKFPIGPADDSQEQ